MARGCGCGDIGSKLTIIRRRFACIALRFLICRLWPVCPPWQLRFRDPKRQGRDYPRDDPSQPALKPKLKPGEVCKLGILSSGDIVGGQK